VFSSNHEILGDTEQRRLAALAKGGDRDATAKLIEHNQRLVYQIAAQNLYRAGVFEMCDLIQQGNLGILAAIERFDPARKNCFITYASFWIYEKITRYCYQHEYTVSIPTNKSQRLSKANRLRSLIKSNGEENSLSDVAPLVGMSTAELRSLAKAAYPVDIDRENDDGNDWHESLGTDGLENIVTERSSAYEIVGFIRSNLPKIGDTLLEHFGLNEERVPLTIEEISVKYHLNPKTVKKRLQRGIAYLKKRFVA